MKNKYEINKEIVFSTRHLQKETYDWLLSSNSEFNVFDW